MSSIILRRPNRLIYPGTRPGFDPSHPASAGFAGLRGFSVVASTGQINFNSVTTGAAGVVSNVGSSTTVIDSIIGPSFVTMGSSVAIQFKSPGIVDTQCTVAAIVREKTNFGVTIFTNCSAAGGIRFDETNSRNLQLTFPYVAALTASSFAILDVVPFFVAASAIGNGPLNYVATNLQTGQIFSSATTTGGSSPNGTIDSNYYLGLAPTAGASPFDGLIAAVMYSPKYLTMLQLLQWAQDPWAFWYPQKIDLADSLSHVIAVAVPSTKSTLPMMGVG